MIQRLVNEQATLDSGMKLARQMKGGEVIFLQGDLGAGKTTFVRGFLSEYGYLGKVKSPTYTLVESYELEQMILYHFDLYRLGDPEELEYMGGRDYFSKQAICLIEWPNKAIGYLPSPTHQVCLSYYLEGRKIEITK